MNSFVYDEMKQSEIQWIGLIPTHWNIRTLYQLVEQVKNKNKDLSEDNLLSLSYGKIKRKDINSSDGLLPASFDGYNIVEKGDIVLRLTDLQNDHTSLRVGLVKERGIITSAYTTLRPQNVNSTFLYYLLHAFDLKKGFYGMGSGVRQGLNYGEVKELRVSIPESKEQEAIAEYLDRRIEELDLLISEIRNSIDDYKKWRASIILESVKGGVDKSIKKVFSGVDWIGEIPDGYRIIKLKYIADIFGRIGFRGYTSEDLVDEGEGPVSLSPSNLKDGNVVYDKCTYLSWEKYNESPEIMIAKEDVLMVKTGASYGKTAIIKELPIESTLNPQLVVFKNIKINNSYLCYYFQTPLLKRQVDYIVTGGTIPTMSQEKMSNFLIMVPPEEVQKEIVQRLDKVTSEIDDIIQEKEGLIEDIELYKRSLIYEMVTGKRKVV